jgi:ribosomal subunit interface protein
MQIALKSKNRKLTSTEEELIRKKVSRLPRYLDQITEAEVIIGEERPRRGLDKQVVQLTVRANGTLLRA